ncbi:MAG: hypothetical protein PHG02_02405 [Oscillospiraceae bacterium]|nr:hypothetical protein [Oscillospiraceae bacterium]
MNLTEKAAYIKGLAEGLDLDSTTKEGKVLTALLELCTDMAQQVTDIDSDVDSICDELEAIDADLTDIEDVLFETDEDEDEDAEEFDGGLYEITCPNCGDVVCVDEDMLEDDNLACPACGTKFEIDFDLDDEETEDKE